MVDMCELEELVDTQPVRRLSGSTFAFHKVTIQHSDADGELWECWIYRSHLEPHDHYRYAASLKRLIADVMNFHHFSLLSVIWKDAAYHNLFVKEADDDTSV